VTGVVLRRATAGDVEAIAAMLADDPLGAARETPGDLTPYLTAFEHIDADPTEELIVAERGGVVVGTLQLSYLRGMSRRGAMRAQIEGVRVAANARGDGLGGELIRWAVERAREHGCVLVQLTTDKTRTDAHRFYDRLGFTATHEGYKLPLAGT
jgi:GNAT superfamily N-acetyltransferase